MRDLPGPDSAHLR